MDKRLDKYKKIRDQKTGEWSIFIGASAILSIFSVKWISKNNNFLSNIFEIYSFSEVIILILASVTIIEGVYVYSKPEILNYKPLKRQLHFIPYMIILGLIMSLYLIYSRNDGAFEEEKVFILIFYLFLIWISVLFEAMKFLKAIKKILKDNVKESKDRLSIVLTVIATVISAIALFK